MPKLSELPVDLHGAIADYLSWSELGRLWSTAPQFRSVISGALSRTFEHHLVVGLATRRATRKRVAAVADLGWALSHMHPAARDERWVQSTRRLANGRFEPHHDTALHLAVEWQRVDLIANLLAAGVNANQPNRYGDTALHTAVRRGDVHVVLELMRSEGVDPNSMGSVGQSPLHVAAASGKADVLEQMLQNPRVDRTLTDSARTPLLFTAAAFGHEEVVRLLAADGFYPNLARADGNGPLHCAAIHGHRRVVETLLAAGADARATNANGDTADALAARVGHVAVAELIRLAERPRANHYGAYLQDGGQAQLPTRAPRARSATL